MFFLYLDQHIKTLHSGKNKQICIIIVSVSLFSINYVLIHSNIQFEKLVQETFFFINQFSFPGASRGRIYSSTEHYM